MPRMCHLVGAVNGSISFEEISKFGQVYEKRLSFRNTVFPVANKNSCFIDKDNIFYLYKPEYKNLYTKYQNSFKNGIR